MSTNKIILRNRHGAEVAAIFFDEDSRRWRIFPKVSRISSAISRPRKKRSIHGTPISTRRLENFASNHQLVSELFTERRAEWSFHNTSWTPQG